MFGKKKKNKDEWDVPERVDAPGYYRQTDYYERRRPDMTSPEYSRRRQDTGAMGIERRGQENAPAYDQMSARHSGQYYSNGRYPDISGDMEKDNGYFRPDAVYYDGGYSGMGYNGVGYRDNGPRYYNGQPHYAQGRGSEPSGRGRYSGARDPRSSAARGGNGSARGNARSGGRGMQPERGRKPGPNDPKRGRGAYTGRVPSPNMYQRKKKKHTGRNIFLVLLLLLIILAGGSYLTVFGRLDHMSLKNLLTNAGIGGKAGTSTFVLYGVDSRTGQLTHDCHSDTIMICTLNKRTKEVKIASVYRDTYLDNTNGEYRKATECYYYGGPERSINMLNKNLDLNISDYMAVNFNAVVKMIDLVGGIDLEITEEEMGYINGYCVENEQVTGVGYTPLSTYGSVHLDGIQALAYCRIRYTEGWDYKRTERQRTVLTKVVQKASGMGPATLISIANVMIPEISTSMNSMELVGLAASLGTYKFGDQTGFPFDKADTNLSVGDCVVPINLAANVSRLHGFLYGEEGYTPSETVQQISNEIANATGIY